MIVTVGNTKGGVGKTTVALNLAIARALAGRDVWFVDGDRQGTAQASIALRAEAKQAPAIACATYPDGSTLRSQVLHQTGKFDDTIIDAGGRDSTALPCSTDSLGHPPWCRSTRGATTSGHWMTWLPWSRKPGPCALACK